MPTQQSASVTRLLVQWGEGEDCLHQLVPLVYAELRRIARYHMRMERSDHTLQTTALIHEAYLRLVDQPPTPWQNRIHFFAIASRLMRHILVDQARGLRREKRGGCRFQLPLDEGLVFSPAKSAELVALDDALTRLASFDSRKAKIVDLRYFGGMSVEETAEALKVHPNTIIRDWSLVVRQVLITG
jgi:RNA polymerase sigma factor (TIGR02999 family)